MFVHFEHRLKRKQMPGGALFMLKVSQVGTNNQVLSDQDKELNRTYRVCGREHGSGPTPSRD